jgi:dTDP-4-amino-4,6-dideoxygalactose transaminase
LTKILGKASSYILKAHAIKARKDGNHTGLAQSFIKAAELEEEPAQRLEAEGHSEDAYISIVSAASCYQQAKDFKRARKLFKRVLTLPNVPSTVRTEVKHLIDECKQDA